MEQPKPFITLEGNIGAGKSTFLRLLGQYINVQCVYEPHEQWQNVNGENILQIYYNDMTRWAYTFQTYAFITRIIEQQKSALNNEYPLQCIERSVYADRYCFGKNFFELGLMTTLEWNLYQDWFNWLVKTYTQKPLCFIYVRTDPFICYKRLQKRNRIEEKDVTFDYLQLLHQKHEDWLIHKKQIDADFSTIPVLVLDCNEDFEFDTIKQKAHIDMVAEFCALQGNFSLNEIKISSPIL